MIMYPAQISPSKYVNGGFLEGGYDCFISLGGGCSDLMAEDESRTDTSINNEEAWDGRMTVGLLIKYLVNKLGLGSESELYFRSNLKGESPSNDCKNMVGEYNLKETLEQTRKWIEGYA
ncbi:hypothetical protein Tco_1055302 [Tanacetum coccineum]|uniref:Uncharacterized protein n=1 Tax=Tanacetum coccineum TaxID=301880 RepID=A0ABQ5GZ85_9ASTR